MLDNPKPRCSNRGFSVYYAGQIHHIWMKFNSSGFMTINKWYKTRGPGLKASLWTILFAATNIVSFKILESGGFSDELAFLGFIQAVLNFPGVLIVTGLSGASHNMSLAGILITNTILFFLLMYFMLRKRAKTKPSLN